MKADVEPTNSVRLYNSIRLFFEADPGMRVCRVYDAESSRECVIKFACDAIDETLYIHSDGEVERGVKSSGSFYEDIVLRQEKLLSSLNHPNIAKPMNSGRLANTVYFSLPYIEGHTLLDLLSVEGCLPFYRSVKMLAQICSAVAYMHDHGLVHGDLSTSNVLIGDGDRVTLIDPAVDAITQGFESAYPGWQFIGTPAYRAPDDFFEFLSDIYSLGAIAFHMFGGRPPFSGSVHDVLVGHKHLAATDLTLVRSQIPLTVHQAVHQALSKNPKDRQQDARQLFHEIQAGFVERERFRYT